ncbi:hypothetical protein PR003_g13652 [Phytophthora rubi]|uniref:Tc1-like transposase DDE domain-containing protein n=1 Tax=Phytophthora rubi TaxID=129364 RepID=A0A6A3L475_9STRA|nr:hypothetical protein PR002_g14405 [Phytophthora rubi]KAE9334162.1 hypothetical protein PR003_g13652 [Phytophthora rubi]
MLPRSKRANFQIQCVVSSEAGLVRYRFERGSIQMNENAAFVDEIYEKVKSCPNFDEHFRGKEVIIVLDNAPAHSQTEERVTDHDDLVLLRLAPYSRIVLKVKIKGDLALSREELVAARPHGQLTAVRMEILQRGARLNINCMDLRLVNKMALRCQHAVAAAERMKDVQ